MDIGVDIHYQYLQMQLRMLKNNVDIQSTSTHDPVLTPDGDLERHEKVKIQCTETENSPFSYYIPDWKSQQRELHTNISKGPSRVDSPSK